MVDLRVKLYAVQLPLGIFCCRGGSEPLRELLIKQLAPATVDHAAALGSFGAELDMDKLRGFDRFVARMAAKHDTSGAMKAEGVDEAAIAAFANELVSRI